MTTTMWRTTIVDCTISGNSAQSGGGIYNGDTITIRNSTAVGNCALVGDDFYNAGWLEVIDSVIGDLYGA